MIHGVPNVITLEVLLYHYYNTEPWVSERRPSKAVDAAHCFLERNGLIVGVSQYEKCAVTPKGCFYVNALKNTPLPVEHITYIIP